MNLIVLSVVVVVLSGNNNFARRTECNRCHTPQGTAGEYSAAAAAVATAAGYPYDPTSYASSSSYTGGAAPYGAYDASSYPAAYGGDPYAGGAHYAHHGSLKRDADQEADPSSKRTRA